MTPRQSRDARGAIVEAATEVFLEAGIDGVSMRQIAGKIGVSATAIYHHFQDKNELMAAVCAAGFEEFGAQLGQAASEPTPLDALRAGSRAYVDFALSHPMHYDVMMVRPRAWALGPNPDRDPDSFTAMVQVISAAQQAGQLAPGDAREAAHRLWAVLHGAVAPALAMPGDIAGLDHASVRTRAAALVEAVIASLQ